MSRETAAADLESGLGAFADELDREIPVFDHGDEQVALFSKQADHLAHVRCADPVQLLLDDGGLDAGDQQFGLVKFPEVEDGSTKAKLFPFKSSNV